MMLWLKGREKGINMQGSKEKSQQEQQHREWDMKIFISRSFSLKKLLPHPRSPSEHCSATFDLSCKKRDYKTHFFLMMRDYGCDLIISFRVNLPVHLQVHLKSSGKENHTKEWLNEEEGEEVLQRDSSVRFLSQMINLKRDVAFCCLEWGMSCDSHLLLDHWRRTKRRVWKTRWECDSPHLSSKDGHGSTFLKSRSPSRWWV